MKYSIRMRAAKGGPHEEGGQHISGAERIVEKEELKEIANQLIERAFTHSKGSPDFLNIRIDEINDDAMQIIDVLSVKTSSVDTVEAGHSLAIKILSENAGIKEIAIKKGLQLLKELPHNMRGAVLLDATSGERLDTMGMRGIRVSMMDFLDDAPIKKYLANGGNIHFLEALVLASKVQEAPGIVGELCYSDDPDYVIGYVAHKGVYHRISKMKDMHSPQGGRIFFVDGSSPIDETIYFLEEIPLLVHVPDLKRISL